MATEENRRANEIFLITVFAKIGEEKFLQIFDRRFDTLRAENLEENSMKKTVGRFRIDRWTMLVNEEQRVGEKLFRQSETDVEQTRVNQRRRRKRNRTDQKVEATRTKKRIRSVGVRCRRKKFVR